MLKLSPWLACAGLTLALASAAGPACRGKEPVADVVEPPPQPIPAPGPPVEVRLDEARHDLRKGEVAKARGRLEQLALEAPTDAAVWTALAAARLAANDARPALEAARRATTLDPKNGEGYVTGGAALRALGDLDAAEKAMEKALAVDPTLVSARWNLAGIYGQRGDLAKEAESLDALLAAHPDDVQARFARAQNALRQKDVAGALAGAQAVVERVPAHMEAQRMLSALAWDRADYREAFERAKIAVRLADGDAAATHLLEASFYVLAAARLGCALGPRPWDGRAMLPVLQALEKEEDLSGAGAFDDMDQRFGEDADVQARVTAARAKTCPPKTP
ncbi:MAG: tetratricopeptide repeat protein [Myxococcota bacterium]